MKRKVIKHGPSTYIVSLPSKWVKEYGIRKGDELEVEESGNEITINTKTGKELRPVSIDVKGYGNIAQRLLAALYKIGYDSIQVQLSSTEERLVVSDTVNDLFIGFEIIEEGKNHVTIKQITFADDESFKDMVRRAFLFLLAIAEDGLEAIKKGDKKQIQDISLRDVNVNKLTTYCRRYINKRGAKTFQDRTTSLYFIVESLEKIGDVYRDIALLLAAQKSLKLNQDVLEILAEINSTLRLAYNSFYNFKKESIYDFITANKKIESKIFSTIGSCSELEAKTLIYCYNLSSLIFHLNGPILVTLL